MASLCFLLALVAVMFCSANSNSLEMDKRLLGGLLGPTKKKPAAEKEAPSLDLLLPVANKKPAKGGTSKLPVLPTTEEEDEEPVGGLFEDILGGEDGLLGLFNNEDLAELLEGGLLQTILDDGLLEFVLSDLVSKLTDTVGAAIKTTADTVGAAIKGTA
uniref:Uncharacterized protein n=1 Tax=Arion vulgaris TaxID=1028688 RepID=A0A0B7A0U9_9EUPU